MSKKRVLSGMQSSGKLHLGNYLGALENWVEMQKDYDCFYFVADWHALSTNYEDTANLKENVIDIGINWLAAGLKPDTCTMFIQSLIPQHAVLHLLFSMITPIPWLERVPSYKEKMENVSARDLHTYGFLGYPVLQAADIVLYNAHFVPVGIDQLPHLELTREIVRHFHQIYKKEVFVLPEGKLGEVKKLPGLDGRKMSKSYGNAIFLSDTPQEREQKILRQMVTDHARVRRNDPGNPDVCHVYSFHKVFSDEGACAQINKDCRAAAIGCVDCKKILVKNLASRMAAFDAERPVWAAQPKKVMEVLRDGTAKARKVAETTLRAAEDAIGISLPEFE